jgi:hypothetical protein
VAAVSVAESLIMEDNDYDHDLTFSLEMHGSMVFAAELSSEVTANQYSNIVESSAGFSSNHVLSYRHWGNVFSHITSTNTFDVMCGDEIWSATSSTQDSNGVVVAELNVFESLTKENSDHLHDISFSLAQSGSNTVDAQLSSKITSNQTSNIVGYDAGFSSTHALSWNTPYSYVTLSSTFDVLCEDDIWSATSTAVDEEGTILAQIAVTESLIFADDDHFEHDISFAYEDVTSSFNFNNSFMNECMSTDDLDELDINDKDYSKVDQDSSSVAIDCIGSWDAWNSCSAELVEARTYIVDTKAANGGSACPGTETQSCEVECSWWVCKSVADDVETTASQSDGELIIKS